MQDLTLENGTQLTYDIIGNEKARSWIIFLHGFGSPLSILNHQVDLLKPYFRILLFEFKNQPLNNDTHSTLFNRFMNKQQEAIEELLNTLHIDRPFGFLAYSLFGTGLALQYTIDHPEEICFLILLNGGTLLLDSSVKQIFWNLLPQFTRMQFNQISPSSFHILVERTLPFIMQALKLSYNSLNEEIVESIRNDINDFLDSRLEPRSINVPTLIVGAELDNYAPIFFSKELHRNIENSELKIVNMTGHFGVSHRYSEYNEYIIEFLKKNSFI